MNGYTFLLSCPCFSFYVFSCRCWLRSLNIALYSSVGYRLKCAVSNSSFSYSAGFMSLLLVIKRTYCSTFPTAASAMAVKASELCKWFRTISCNKWICNCIYRKCARGCKQIQTVWDSKWSTQKHPKGCTEQNPANTYCITEIWNIHDIQCQGCQSKHIKK